MMTGRRRIEEEESAIVTAAPAAGSSGRWRVEVVGGLQKYRP